MRTKPIACGKNVADRLSDFAAKSRELVLEPLARLIRERQIAWVGAHPKHLRVDELNRQVQTIIALRVGGRRSEQGEPRCKGQRADKFCDVSSFVFPSLWSASRYFQKC